MQILVTGGLGYIGLHFVNQILKSYNQNITKLILIDNLSNSSIENLKCLNPDKIDDNQKSDLVVFYNIDIRNEEELRKIFEIHPIDLVIHFASLKSVPESNSKSLLYYDNNVSGAITLLKVMNFYKCNKIIFSSSACVYKESNEPHNEDEKTESSNPYGRTKSMIEEILRDANLSFGLECVILRYFNPVGMMIENMSFSKTISNLMDVILDSIVYSKQFSVFGNDYDTKDGTCVRDFIHIYDLVMGHIKALEYIFRSNKNSFDIFNLGCGKGISILELILSFEKTNHISLNYFFGKRRVNDVQISLSNINKANKILNWHPTKTIEDMCKDSYKYINNVSPS
jgi:UDP-glucose 4-epimerase